MLTKQEEYIFMQAQEMFPQLDADVLCMILSEHKFQIDEALQSLMILTQTMEDAIDENVPLQNDFAAHPSMSQSEERKLSATVLKVSTDFNVYESVYNQDHDLEYLPVLKEMMVESKLPTNLQPNVVEGEEEKEEECVGSNKICESQKNSSASLDDEYIATGCEENVDIGFKPKLKKLFTVLSYTTVGKLNGVRLSFEGGGQRVPSTISKVNSHIVATTVFNPLKKQLENTSYQSNDISLSSELVTKEDIEPCPSIRDGHKPDFVPETAFVRTEELISTVIDVETKNVLSTSTPELNLNANKDWQVEVNETLNGNNGSFFVDTDPLLNPPNLQRTCEVFPNLPSVDSLPWINMRPHHSATNRGRGQTQRYPNNSQRFSSFPSPVYYRPVSSSGYPRNPPPGFSGRGSSWSVPAPQRHYSPRSSSYHYAGSSFSPTRATRSPSQHLVPKPRNDQCLEIYLMRGAPGSGKSTLAKKLAGKNGVILSTDDFFMIRGIYYFDPSRLSEAHSWNQRQAEQFLSKGMSPVVIDNTNIVGWEMRPYMMTAIKYSYHIYIKEPDTPWKRKASELTKRNSHGVPKDSIINMLDRYEENLTVEKVVGREAYQEYLRKINPKSPAKRNEKQSVKPALSKNFKKLSLNENNVKRKLSATSQERAPNSSTSCKAVTSNKNSDHLSFAPPTAYGMNTDDQKTHISDEEDCTSSSSSFDELMMMNDKINSGLSSEVLSDKDRYEIENAFRLMEQRESASTSTNLSNLTKGNDCSSEQKVLQLAPVADSTKDGKNLSPSPNNFGKPSNKMSKNQLKNRKLAPVFDCPILENKPDSNNNNWKKYFDDSLSTRFVPQGTVNKDFLIKERNTVETRTEEEDFVLLRKVENNVTQDVQAKVFLGNGLNFHSEFSVDKLDRISWAKTFDKSSSTADLEETAVDSDEDLATLRLLFSDLPPEHLKDVYLRCEKQLHLATDLIAEDSLFGAGSNLNIDDYYDALCVEDYITFGDTSEKEEPSELSQTEVADRNREQPSIRLKLPEEFLRQLILVFGEGESLDSDEFEIDLDVDTAKAIYNAWKTAQKKEFVTEDSASEHSTDVIPVVTESVPRLREIFGTKAPTLDEYSQDKQNQCEADAKQLREDEELARKLQEEEYKTSPMMTKRSLPEETTTTKKLPTARRRKIKHKAPNLYKESPSRSSNDSGKWSIDRRPQKQKLSQIMAEEQAAHASEQRQSAQLRKTKLSSQLKKEQLHAMFPAVPKHILDEMFVSNDCNLQITMETAACIFSEEELMLSSSDTSSTTGETSKMQETNNLGKFSASSSQKMINIDAMVPEIISEKNTYQDLRAEAKVHRQQMHECQKKAAVATHQHRGPLASYYREQAKMHMNKLREANQRAANITYQKMNEGRSKNELDLHGLHVDEAIDTLKSVIAEKRKERNKPRYFFVITGRGLNSHLGVPKIKNAVMEFLKMKKMAHKFVNAGMIKVFL
ncbi:uncharacterized protein LOC143447240 [Clavelina lepadiformis]|uniref:uncharacterized protein LOC143447240 n=1 Tax=Clavelina lepadiformis TaxID=159417 RepID=UPI004042160F